MALVLLMDLLFAPHVLDKVGVLAEIKGAPQNFEFICEYHAAGFKEAHYVAPLQNELCDVGVTSSHIRK